MENRSRKGRERNWVTSVLDSHFIPLQKLFEDSALSIGPLKTEVKGTISLALHTEDRTLRTQPAVPHSFSTVLLIWKFQTTLRVSAAFQGHKGNHKQKSLLPPIPNLPPSKSSLAVLQRLHSFSKPLFTSPLELWSKTTVCDTSVCYSATIYIKGNFRFVCIYLEVV